MTPNHTHTLYLFFVYLGNHIYWSDWKDTSLNRCDKRTGKNKVTILKHHSRNLGMFMDVKAIKVKLIKGKVKHIDIWTWEMFDYGNKWKQLMSNCLNTCHFMKLSIFIGL